MFCAYRVGGPLGVLVGGLGFIVPAVTLVILLSLLFLAHTPPGWVRGAGAGGGAAVTAVALHAARGLLGPSYRRVRGSIGRSVRWAAYLLAGVIGTVVVGPELVLVLFACGAIEVVWKRRRQPLAAVMPLLPGSVSVGGIGALAWTALKVGALSFGGGFVIIPLMQGDAVHAYHWMTNGTFLNAVALGQVTPGPVVATVSAVGYAAHGIGGALLAAAVAFAPSFLFVLLGGRRFERIRRSSTAQAFLDGADPAAIGAILGAAILLAAALQQWWQFPLLGVAVISVLLLNWGVVRTLLGAGAFGVLAALAGASLPH